MPLVNKFLLGVGVTLLTFLVISTVGLFLVANLHQGASETFWGELYDPNEDNSAIDYGFVINTMLPEGGPMLGTAIPGVCPDTPLPMVPVKILENGRAQILCGIGAETVVMGFNPELLPDESLRDALTKAFQDELAEMQER